MAFGRPPIEERIAARQRERGELKHGAVFPHAPAKMLFFFSVGVVVVTHAIALAMYFVDAGPGR
ncbi:hypothetical protein SAMN05443665_102284 [Actinomadura meyerae]|jgi:hypothetical protein|uniref:Uncharacterized protein n=1 Tax=Actinomadura meyerae TaxID=240840 RepID=A0A239LI70_9ACTN|nr:hypothetical protein [Actinomadura meyerae]SNT29244.1 hypothetical protein SAMN05443665_102284 [Actinomadura meyerae]